MPKYSYLFPTVAAIAAPAAAQDHHHMPGMAMPAAPMPAPAPAPAPAPTPAPAPADPHAGHDMAGMNMSDVDEGTTDSIMLMPAAFGPYRMQREASGTSWQPDASTMMGAMSMRGSWHLMGHALLNGVYDHQSGPRGADKGFISGMVMG